MVFREVFTIFTKVSSGSALGTHVDVVGATLVMILAIVEISWGLLGSLAAPLGLLGAVCLGTLSELSWGALGPSWGSLEPPSASLGSLLALKGAPGGLRGSFSVDLSVEF